MPSSSVDSRPPPGSRASAKKKKKKGSSRFGQGIVSFSRSGSSQRRIGRKQKRSLTKHESQIDVVSSARRVPSLGRRSKKEKAAGDADMDSCEGVEATRKAGDSGERSPSPSLLDDDLDDDDIEVEPSTSVDADRSLRSLSALETDFIGGAVARLHALGYDDRGVDVHSLGTLLREILGWERPFVVVDPSESFDSPSRAADGVRGGLAPGTGSPRRSRPRVNVDPLWRSLEHSLSLGGASHDGGRYGALDASSLTTRGMRSVIRGVLRDMNVKAIKGGVGGGPGGGVRQRRVGSWGNLLFASSWSSLNSCHCGLF